MKQILLDYEKNADKSKQSRSRTVKQKGGFWAWIKNDLNKFFNR
jgi:hypothetical protein